MFWKKVRPESEECSRNKSGSASFVPAEARSPSAAGEPENKTQKRRKTAAARGLRNVRVLTFAASMTAVSYLLGALAKLLQGTGVLRLTFENLPVILSSILCGPFIGAAVGTGADLLSCVSAGQAWNPLITAGVIVIGLVAGVLGRRIRPGRPSFLPILRVELIAHLLGSVLVKSAALALLFRVDIGYLCLRIPIYLAVALIESFILFFVFSSPALLRPLERITRK